MLQHPTDRRSLLYSRVPEKYAFTCRHEPTNERLSVAPLYISVGSWALLTSPMPSLKVAPTMPRPTPTSRLRSPSWCYLPQAPWKFATESASRERGTRWGVSGKGKWCWQDMFTNSPSLWMMAVGITITVEWWWILMNLDYWHCWILWWHTWLVGQPTRFLMMSCNDDEPLIMAHNAMIWP